MESLSFESTIESPTKPHQEKLPDKNNKSLFLVQTISETDISKQSIQNLENDEIKEKANKKHTSHILNFDDVLSIIYPKEKPKKQSPKQSGKNLLNNKRKRPINKSKIYLY